MLSDIDYYDTVKDVIEKEGIQISVAEPRYFKGNPFSNIPVKTFLPEILKQIGVLTNEKGSLVSMFDAIKNAFTGKLHFPHPHFIQ